MVLATMPCKMDGLDISPADDGYIIYDPDNDRVHYLNPTAVLILELCDGRHSEQEVIQLVKEFYALPSEPAEEVQNAIAALTKEGLLAV
jgi:hypothetical protein